MKHFFTRKLHPLLLALLVAAAQPLEAVAVEADAPSAAVGEVSSDEGSILVDEIISEEAPSDDTLTEYTTSEEIINEISQEISPEDDSVVFEQFGADDTVPINEEVFEARADLFQNGSFHVHEATAQFFNRNYDAAYDLVVKGMLDHKSYISIPSSYEMTVDDAGMLFGGAVNEHPELYYVNSVYYYGLTGSHLTSIQPVYDWGFDDEAFDNAAADALSYIKSGMSPEQKAAVLHDYLASAVDYDYNLDKAGENANDYSAYGALVDHIAVCQGISLAYKYLLRLAGVDCYIISSDSINHMWCLVDLGEGGSSRYYQVDVTWDDPLLNDIGRVDHEFMFLTDALSEAKHFTGGAFGQDIDWEIAYRGQALNKPDYAATDDTLQTRPYVDIDTPLVYYGEGGSGFYYLRTGPAFDNCSLVKYSFSDGTETTIFTIPDITWGSYISIYSGLFQKDGRLWFNTPSEICSIGFDGTDLKTEYTADDLGFSAESAMLFGCAYINGGIYYSPQSAPSDPKNFANRRVIGQVEPGPSSHRGIWSPDVRDVGYTGYPITFPDMKVYYDDELLDPDTDYTVKYSNNTAVGMGKVIITGKGIYSGSRALSFRINAPAPNIVLLKNVKAAPIPKQTYTGEPIIPAITLTHSGKTLVEGIDYDVSFSDNTDAGTALATLTGKGLFGGVRVLKFKITGISIAKCSVTGYNPSYEYTGSAIRPDEESSFKVTVSTDQGGTDLVKITDYEVSYLKNKNAGKATMIIKGKGRYSGTVKKYFSIKKKDQSGFKVTLTDSTFAYQKGGAQPMPVVTDIATGDILVKGRDYKLSYKNNKTVGSSSDPKPPTVVVTGKGNYSGSNRAEFNVIKSEFDNSAFSITASDLKGPVTTAKPVPKVTIIDTNGKKLKPGLDFTYEYNNSYGIVRAYGRGNYTGQMVAYYRIVDTLISKAKVTVLPQEYTGSQVIPSKNDIKIKVGGTILGPTDYEVIPAAENINIGTGKIIIHGIGKFGGSKTVSYKIKKISL